MSDMAFNETVDSALNIIAESLNISSVVNETLSLIEPTLSKIDKLTNQLTYFIFDNQLINSTIGTSLFSQIILILIAIFAIIIGSYASIIKPSNALPPNEFHPLFDQTDKDSTETPIEEQIDTTAVLILPVLAGITLIGIYYFIKNYNKTQISSFLNKYIMVMSFSSVSFFFSYLYKSISRKICYLNNLNSMKINNRYSFTISNDKKIHPLGFEKEWLMLPDHTERDKIIKEEKLLEIRSDIEKENQIFNFYFTTGDIYGYSFGLVFCILFNLYDGSKNWIINNILGFSMVVMGISKTKIPTFKLATLLLTLFFFYDIYFVFGTDIMVSVATGIDIPAKLLIPNIVSKEENKISTSMLGLGDLALPGAFIALCLRFDLYNFHDKNKNLEFHHLQFFPKPYFKASIIGYSLSLFFTCKIVEFYHVGQPALLYLCPGVIISVYLTAIFRGEFSKLWNYDETPIDNKNKKDIINKEVIEIICSKETLFLSGEITEEDVEDVEDEDYQYYEESDDSEEEEEEGDENYEDK
ncbi:hypothetical protein C6P40_000470 [Pichia californica]|uniref:Uncharacterized protein n=1 Tax=Pichia californica TaxID=460514 RepID=A0A9P6WPN4_9ASCO|nr:hypothetical protein C6P42_001862 [[Candida] californica]KAG0690972.1 hypothetical protein C6P40_000470 [[Candida] californica]